MKLLACTVQAFIPVALLFVMNLLWLLLPISESFLGNETDRDALIMFRESISRDPNGILSSWNESTHFCMWQGVSCGIRHQGVTALDLEGQQLQGMLSPSIGNLSFLTLLNLQNNSFSGEIPQEVGRLFRLRFLFINRNNFEGKIPSGLSNCTKLKTIAFSRNNLIGSIPEELGSLSNIEELHFNGNKLTGRIPASLGNISFLKCIVLLDNNLHGNIPFEIVGWKSISIFDVAVNNLSGPVPSSLYNKSSISFISVGSNMLNGSLPSDFGMNLPNLRTFDIRGNQFSGQIPKSLTNASKLKFLDMGDNKLFGNVPPNLGCLQDLNMFSLLENKLGSNSTSDLGFLQSLSNCSNLKLLNLNSNNFGGAFPSSIGNLSTSLRSLYLGRNPIHGALPASLENLVDLDLLDLGECLLTGPIPAYLGKFSMMEGLYLYGNRFSGNIPSSLGNLSRLVELYLFGNRLAGSIPSSLENCRNLQKLDISDNNLSGTIPRQVMGLSSVTVRLSLSHNSFTGFLPDLGALKQVVTFDISENNLFGEIPSSIEACSALENLYVQGNFFGDGIPLSITSLKGLQQLDLSRNNFSGQIPRDIQNLRFLQYLNLSFNNLEGEVPTKGVFQNLTRTSIIGNSRLCGGIPELQLPPCPISPGKHRKHGALKLMLPIIFGVLGFSFIIFFIVAHGKRKGQQEISSNSRIGHLSKVSYKTLHDATAGFAEENLVGHGSIGSVYKGVISSSETVAVKVFNLLEKGASRSFIAECEALIRIRHRNLVKILTCCSSIDFKGNEFKALVFEFMSNGSLDKWLHPEMNGNQSHLRILTLIQRLNIAVDVAFALHYLHEGCEKSIIHCDIKPSNVLLDKKMNARISDFGLARLNEQFGSQISTNGLIGTIGYVAPEYGIGCQPSPQGDVYSFGILILEMFTGRIPTDGGFKEGFDLHQFVKTGLLNGPLQIIDPTLLKKEVEEEMEEGLTITEQLNQMDNAMEKCLLSVFNIGVACSMKSPNERMSMGDAMTEMYRNRSYFLYAQSLRQI